MRKIYFVPILVLLLTFIYFNYFLIDYNSLEEYKVLVEKKIDSDYFESINKYVELTENQDIYEEYKYKFNSLFESIINRSDFIAHNLYEDINHELNEIKNGEMYTYTIRSYSIKYINSDENKKEIISNNVKKNLQRRIEVIDEYSAILINMTDEELISKYQIFVNNHNTKHVH